MSEIQINDVPTIKVHTKQNRKKLTIQASTFRELKTELSKRGIDINAKFVVRPSKMELVADSTKLQGVEKVYMFPPETKAGMDRSEMYKYIKENDLAEEVKSQFGRNFTQVKSDDLASFIDSHNNSEESDCDETVQALREENARLKARIAELEAELEDEEDDDEEDDYWKTYNEIY